jgi:hypothetical protein
MACAIKTNDLHDKVYVERIMEMLPPPPDSRRCVLACEFAAAVHNQCPGICLETIIACGMSLFSSADHLVKQVTVETRRVLIDIIRGFSEEKILELGSYNEGRFCRVCNWTKS